MNHISINLDRCQGHNRCLVFAPEVFETDEFGYASVIAGAEVTSEEVVARVRDAIANCPEGAIQLSTNESMEGNL